MCVRMLIYVTNALKPGIKFQPINLALVNLRVLWDTARNTINYE